MMASELLETNQIYQALKGGLKEHDVPILASGSKGYEESIKRWSEAAEKRACAVVLPSTTEHVSEVIKVARKYSIEFVVCCGRHSTGGASSIEDGIVIDLRNMNSVEVNEEEKLLTVGGGCTWKDVDEEAAKFGLATVGGTVNHTGVGGLILGGGWGWLTPRYGLTIDNLVSVNVVLADGRIVTASSSENPDFFWAIRGAGSSFAVTTSFTLRAYPQQNPVWAGTLVYTPDKLDQIVHFANKHHENAEDQGLIFGYMCAPPTFVPMLMAVVFFNGPEEEGKDFFSDLYTIGPVVDMTRTMPYQELNSMFNDAATFGERKSSGASAISYPFQPSLFQEVWNEYTGFIEQNKEGGVEGSIVLFSMIPYKKILEVPIEKTAFGSRGEYYNAELLLRWRDPALDTTARQFNRKINAFIRKEGNTMGSRGVGNYPNNIEHQIDPKRVFGVNTERLVELKKKYDPDNCFRKWHDVLYQEKAE